MKQYNMLSLPCILLAMALLLCACGAGAGALLSGEAGNAAPPSSEAGSAAPLEPAAPTPSDNLPSTAAYLQQVVQEHAARIEQPGMSEYEKVKAAFDYVMELGYYQRPIALDVWRWRTAADTMPSYEQMRGLHMLLFGFETCEGYAASLNMLLGEMGIETRYMTGMTYLARGGLGYHSWSQVKIDGVWYHLDSELEDGIARSSGRVIYRYFLRSDTDMSTSHFWGERLINLGELEPGQVDEVAAHYMGESCPQSYSTPAPKEIAVNPEPDTEGLRAQLLDELAEYEALYGPLAYQELDILPPVFIRYYFVDGQPPADAGELVRDYRERRLIIDPPAPPSRAAAGASQA